MWRTGLPKWINTITSSRWLWHFVPFPVIALMLYWLPLSGEQKPHAALPLPSTHLHRSHTLLSVNPQSIFHRALEWLFHKLIGHTSHRLTLKVWWGTWEEDSKVDINTSGPIFNAQTQKPVHSVSISWLASPSAPATLCSRIYSSTICLKKKSYLHLDETQWMDMCGDWFDTLIWHLGLCRFIFIHHGVSRGLQGCLDPQVMAIMRRRRKIY